MSWARSKALRVSDLRMRACLFSFACIASLSLSCQTPRPASNDNYARRCEKLLRSELTWESHRQDAGVTDVATGLCPGRPIRARSASDGSRRGGRSLRTRACPLEARVCLSARGLPAATCSRLRLAAGYGRFDRECPCTWWAPRPSKPLRGCTLSLWWVRFPSTPVCWCGRLGRLVFGLTCSVMFVF